MFLGGGRILELEDIVSSNWSNFNTRYSALGVSSEEGFKRGNKVPRQFTDLINMGVIDSNGTAQVNFKIGGTTYIPNGGSGASFILKAGSNTEHYFSDKLSVFEAHKGDTVECFVGLLYNNYGTGNLTWNITIA